MLLGPLRFTASYLMSVDPVHHTTPWRHLFDQARLLLSEWLLSMAVAIAPEDHPDSEKIVQAALEVSSRKPAPTDWRSTHQSDPQA